jgi:hypothetical protein
LVDHCNPPYCCVYRDLFLCCSLSVGDRLSSGLALR